MQDSMKVAGIRNDKLLLFTSLSRWAIQSQIQHMIYSFDLFKNSYAAFSKHTFFPQDSVQNISETSIRFWIHA